MKLITRISLVLIIFLNLPLSLYSRKNSKISLQTRLIMEHELTDIENITLYCLTVVAREFRRCSGTLDNMIFSNTINDLAKRIEILQALAPEHTQAADTLIFVQYVHDSLQFIMNNHSRINLTSCNNDIQSYQDSCDHLWVENEAMPVTALLSDDNQQGNNALKMLSASTPINMNNTLLPSYWKNACTQIRLHGEEEWGNSLIGSKFPLRIENLIFTQIPNNIR